LQFILYGYCFTFFAPTIEVEILSNGKAIDSIQFLFFPFSILSIFLYWKDWSGKRDPKGGAQIQDRK